MARRRTTFGQSRPVHRTIPPVNAAAIRDAAMDERLTQRIEELRRHLVSCASCSTCESTALAHALTALLDELRGDQTGIYWTGEDIRAVLAETLL